MQKQTLRKFVIALLIYSLIFVQVLPSLSMADEKKKKIAIVGIKFENMPRRNADIMTWRFEEIFVEQNRYLITKPDQAKTVYGSTKMDKLLTTQDIESFRQFAEQFEFAHVFAGKLTNHNPDSSDVFLVGELTRFDLSNSQISRYRVRSEYEKFGNDLKAFKDQFVEPLASSKKDGLSTWHFVISGGLVVATILGLRLASRNSNSENEGSNPGNGGDN